AAGDEPGDGLVVHGDRALGAVDRHHAAFAPQRIGRLRPGRGPQPQHGQHERAGEPGPGHGRMVARTARALDRRSGGAPAPGSPRRAAPGGGPPGAWRPPGGPPRMAPLPPPAYIGAPPPERGTLPRPTRSHAARRPSMDRRSFLTRSAAAATVLGFPA